jgi:site-specific DNA recombinase
MLVEPSTGGAKIRRRSLTAREYAVGRVPALVSEEFWRAAQEGLAANRISKNSTRTYLARGVVKCGLCALNYVGATHNRLNAGWYRCNGQLVERGPIEGRCPSKAVKTWQIDNVIWTTSSATWTTRAGAGGALG